MGLFVSWGFDFGQDRISFESKLLWQGFFQTHQQESLMKTDMKIVEI